MTKNQSFLFTLFLAVASCLLYFQVRSSDAETISYNLFRNNQGWGYNILVNGNIIIHQDKVPVMPEHNAFKLEVEARAAAQLVVTKIKAKKDPSLDQSEIETIFSPTK